VPLQRCKYVVKHRPELTAGLPRARRWLSAAGIDHDFDGCKMHRL
jgi:hypothetical protein